MFYEYNDESDHTFDIDSDDSSCDYLDYRDQNSAIKSKLKNVNWEIRVERYQFLYQLYPIFKHWEGKLPNLREIFKDEEIEHLLWESVIDRYDENDSYIGELFIKFLAKTGYKDEPTMDDDGIPLLQRTTPIHYVARYKLGNWNTVVRELFKIYSRYDVNYIDQTGLSHFHLACLNDCYDVVENFLKLGQDPNCRGCVTGDSPLHFALFNNCKEIAELLLRWGADPNTANLGGLTALHIMCKNNYDDDFLNHFFNITKEGHQLVHIDARDILGRTPLHIALYHREVVKAMLLLSRGANPYLADNAGMTPLQIICENDFYYDCGEVISFFEISDKNYPVEVNTPDRLGNTQLHSVLLRDRVELALLLLGYGANPNLPNAQGETSLHIICQRFYDDDFLKLLFIISDEQRYSVQIDARDKLGNTPLLLALSNGNRKAAELLLKRGADRNLANDEGWTPLHVICHRDHDDHDFVEILFKTKDEQRQLVHIDARNKLGDTPLHLALCNDNKTASEFLISIGANLNLANMEGSTPLQMLCTRYDDNNALAKKFLKINYDIDEMAEVDAQDSICQKEWDDDWEELFCENDTFIQDSFIKENIQHIEQINKPVELYRTPLKYTAGNRVRPSIECLLDNANSMIARVLRKLETGVMINL